MEQGVFDGDCKFSCLPHEKNIMGLGTFKDFDGEMVAVDGEYFQIKSDGKVYAVNDSQVTPFVQVVNFESKEHIDLQDIQSYDQLNTILDKKLLKKNFPYALRIDGKMKSLKIRSVCKQNKPYPPVVEAIKGQVIFDLENVEGSMVGFWFPDYWEKISLPGFHFHFISSDRKYGGHVLDVHLVQGHFSSALLQNLSISLPNIETFSEANLNSGRLSSEKLQKIAMESEIQFLKEIQ